MHEKERINSSGWKLLAIFISPFMSHFRVTLKTTFGADYFSFRSALQQISDRKSRSFLDVSFSKVATAFDSAIET